MPEWAAALASALVANILQGGVALIWVSGLRRVARPTSAAFQAASLEFVLVIPFLTAISRLFVVPGISQDFALLRVERWMERLGHAEAFLIAFGFLAVGSALIFLFQELLPLWKRAREMPKGAQTRDPRLDLAMSRVLEDFSRLPKWRGRLPLIFRLESSESLAALQGVAHPRILISSGLLSDLDDQELDAVIAHELAHAAFGGNGRMIFLWFVRALQAMNPAALIAFRGLLEQRERACDELAAMATQRPAALASALLRVHEGGLPRAGDRRYERARAEVLRRIEVETTRGRVRALLDAPVGEYRNTDQFSSSLARVFVAIVMGGMLWIIR